MKQEQQEQQQKTPTTQIRPELVGFGQYFGRTEPTTVGELSSFNIKGVVVGESHVVAWTEDEVFTRGRNYSGQLGLGHFDDVHKKRFEKVQSLTGEHPVAVQCGQFHTVLLTEKGQVLTWGANTTGQLCNGSAGADDPNPTLVDALTDHNIVDVACGASFTVFCTADGKVLTCGDNSFGQLGLGNTNNQSVPKEVVGLRGTDVESVSCGGKHCAALVRHTGEVFVWGSNKQGQLGQLFKGWFFVKDKVTLPKCVPWITNLGVIRIQCGGLHTLVLEKHGRLHVFGDNSYGQLGLGFKGTPTLDTKNMVELDEKVVDMACFRFHNIAHTETGELYAWGPNVSGQIGVDTGGCVAFAPRCVEALKGRKLLAFAPGHALTTTVLLMAAED